MTAYAMCLDINHCTGCYSCVVACKMANGTQPEVNWNAVERVEWGEFPNAHQRYVPTLCMHCDAPGCVEVCPTGASTKSENGKVLIDYAKCIGCGLCVQACPYDQRHLVEERTTQFEGFVAPYEEKSQKRGKVAEKCTFCQERTEQGQLPACVANCPGHCRIFGDIDDPESEISKYISSHNAMKIEGTSIYYVKPENMDRSFLPIAAIANTSTSDQISETGESSESNNSVPIAAIGIAGVAAVAAAVGVAKRKSTKGGDRDNG